MLAIVKDNPLLPPSPKPVLRTKRGMGIYVEQDVLQRADAIVEQDHWKSRNQLFSVLLSFVVELVPALKPHREAIEAVATKEGISYAEAVARLVQRGLRAKGK